MKRILPLAAMMLLLVSCNKSNQPKAVAKEFVKSLYLLDYEKASSLATTDTKANVSDKTAKPVQADPQKRIQSFTTTNFLLDSLKENVQGNSATIESDGISLSLIKESGKWRVLASDKVVDNIVNKNEKEEAVKAKWEQLKKAYEDRMQAAKDYATYKASQGTVSTNVQALLEALGNTSIDKNFNQQQLLEYVARQNEISSLLDKAVEPSYTANADLSVNFIIRINEAEKAIQAAKNEYNLAIQDIKSPVFSTIPDRTNK
jgi:hypothetical protein